MVLFIGEAYTVWIGIELEELFIKDVIEFIMVEVYEMCIDDLYGCYYASRWYCIECLIT